jgi:hypothetical protein
VRFRQRSIPADSPRNTKTRRPRIALALREGLPALTADGEWSEIDIDVEIRVIR